MAQVGAFSTTKRDGTFEGPIVGPENFLLLPVEGDQPNPHARAHQWNPCAFAFW